MNKYTAQQILEDSECEEIRNKIKELIRNYRYTDALLYVQRHLTLSSSNQAKKCVNILMNEVVKQVKPQDNT